MCLLPLPFAREKLCGCGISSVSVSKLGGAVGSVSLSVDVMWVFKSCCIISAIRVIPIVRCLLALILDYKNCSVEKGDLTQQKFRVAKLEFQNFWNLFWKHRWFKLIKMIIHTKYKRTKCKVLTFKNVIKLLGNINY